MPQLCVHRLERLRRRREVHPRRAGDRRGGSGHPRERSDRKGSPSTSRPSCTSAGSTGSRWGAGEGSQSSRIGHPRARADRTEALDELLKRI